MMGFLTRQLREIIALVEAMGRRLATSAALLVAALIFLLACFAFLSVALYLWVAEVTEPALAALSVAGFHLVIAGACVIAFWLRGRAVKPSKKTVPPISNPEDQVAAASRAELADSIDQTMAPLIAILHEAGMKPEEATLRLGTTLAKQVGPMALVALALAAGFMFGRRLTTPKD
jgi:hypothetical protein